MRLDKISAERTVPLFLAALVFLASGGLLGINGFFHDDTAWLVSTYNSTSLAGFLNTGFIEMRRQLMGMFLYLFLGLHKTLPMAVAHAVWDLTIMGATFGAALALFHLARRVLGGGTFAPAVAAALLAVHPIDTTLPVHIQVVYRIGVFVALLSLLLTHMAVVERSRWKLAVAVLLSAMGSFVFIEGVVMYEAARLAIIYIALNDRGKNEGRWALLRAILVPASPFLASALALAVLKIAFPPSGLYTGAYVMSAANLLRPDNLGAMLKAIFLSSWTCVLPFGLRYGLFPLGLGLAGAALMFVLIKHVERDTVATSRAKRTVFVGLLLFLAPAMLYLLVGKVPTPGVESRHGTALEPGWALIVGGLVAMAMAKGRRSARVFALASALLVGMGVFASNVSIDIYKEAFDREILFWEKFIARFPTLPENAPVIFDVKLGGPDIPSYRSTSAWFFYQFEFPLNLLYATSRTPQRFRAHPALEKITYTNFDFFALYDTVLYNTYWGTTQLFPRRAIFVHYRDGELLINEEIADRYIGLPYQALLDRPAPVLPPPPQGGYPYRDRMTRLFNSGG